MVGGGLCVPCPFTGSKLIGGFAHGNEPLFARRTAGRRRHPDVNLPLRYGVDRCVGDTSCAGGILYGQRNIPVGDRVHRAQTG
jgi:hypothetical protein